MICVLAGRRIDLTGAEPVRFPLRHASLVRARLLTLFRSYPVSTLVCSAACGADLLALDAAGELGWKRFVVLPFDRARFRDTSVTDRTGNWGSLYDSVLDAVGAAGTLIILEAPPGPSAYKVTNEKLMERAHVLAEESGESQAAIVVWDGNCYGPDDLTAAFASEAQKRGLQVVHVSTLE